MLARRAARLAAFLFFFLADAALAQDVTLTSRDGSVSISGALLGYDGEFYRVDSIYGVLTLDGSGVICTGPGCPDLTAYVATIRFSGEAAATRVLLPALISAFAERQGYELLLRLGPDGGSTYELSDAQSGQDAARFVLRETTGAEVFADLMAFEADLAISLREATKREVALGLDAGIGQLDSARQSRVLALDALVPVVATKNPVARITLADLAGVMTGEIANWQDLGGPDAPIVLHIPDASSALSEVAARLITGGAAQPRAAVMHRELDALVDAVARDPFAFGLSALSEIGSARVVTLTDGCGFLAKATAESLKSEDYPLTAPIFLYLAQRRLPAVGRDFLRFIRSPAAQHAIRRAGFADQSLTETPLSEQGGRLSNAIRAAGSDVGLVELQGMIEQLDGLNRLSLGFRFENGTIRLDAQSRSNIGLLAEAIEAGLYDGRGLLFAGFSDSDGPAEANLRLSRQRAEALRDEVIAAAATADLTRLRIGTEGFGEAMPMACDDTEEGRGINRRVEIWLR